MKPRETILSTTPSSEEIAQLRLGDIVYLDGLIYTAREGVYMHVLEGNAEIPLELPSESAANFHCSPAATIHEDGSFDMGAVTATASFRFAKWLPEWMSRTGARLIIGKGGMSSKDYKSIFRSERRDLPVHCRLRYRGASGARHRKCRGRALERGTQSCTGHVGDPLQPDGPVHRCLGSEWQLPV